MGRKIILSAFIISMAFIFLLPSFFAAEVGEDLHLNIQTTYSNGTVRTGTFDFAFNISLTDSCDSIVYSNLTSLTTDARGIISYYLPDVSLNYSDQYWLCYYRDGSLVNTSKIARTPYAFQARNVTLSGVEVDTNLDATGYNVTANYGFFQYLGSLLNQITGLFVTDVNATGTIYAQSTKNLSIGYDYALNGTIGSSYWTANWTNFTTLYANDVSNASTRGYAINASLWTLNYTDYLATRGYALNDSLWTLNYSTYLTKPTWVQVTNGTMASWANVINGTMASWANVVNGTMLSYAQALNNTLMQQANWNSTNTSYFDLNKANTVGAFNQTFDTSTLFIDSVSDRVGIGTTSPAEALDVAGDIQATGAFQTTGNEIIYAGSTLGQVKFFRPATTDDIALYAGGAERLRINGSQGNIGINTTTPQNTINVLGDGNFTGTIYAQSTKNLSIGYDYATNGTFSGAGEPLWTANYSNVAFINQANIFGAFNQTFDTNTLFLDSVSDRVGIGTTAPTEALDVVGDIQATGAFQTTGNEIIYAGSTLGQVKFFRPATTDDIALYAGGAERLRINGSQGNIGIGTPAPNATLNIFSAENASFLANNATNAHLFVNGSTGRVGIGTTSPSEKLEINNGNISLSKPDAEHEISISLYSEGEINSRIAFSGDVGGSSTGGLDIRVLENFGISDLDQNSRFFIRENTGNVGINTNKPQNKLNVVGDANVTGNFTGGNVTVTDTLYLVNSPIDCVNGFSVGFHGSTQNCSANTGGNFIVSGLLNVTGNLTADGGTLFVDSVNNRVGIGTANPLTLLDLNHSGINGTITTAYAIRNANMNYTNTGLGTAIDFVHYNISGNAFNSSRIVSINEANFTNGTSQNDAGLGFYTLGDAILAERLRISAIGSVGINTTSPLATLNVNSSLSAGSFLVSNLTYNHFFVNGSTGQVGIGTTTPQNKLNVVGTGNVTGNFSVDNTILFVDTASDMVGIGTNSPSQKLDVSGGIQIGDASSAEAGVIRWTGLEFQAYNGTDWNTFAGFGTGGVWSTSGSDIYYSLGNVGIGTADPNSTLHVVGITNITGNFSAGGNTFFVNNISSRVGIGTTTPQNTLNVVGDINATTSIFAQSTKNLSIGYDYATNGSISTFESDPKWTANYSNFTTLYSNDVGNASTRGYALNATPWTLNYSNFTTLYGNDVSNASTRGYALNDSLWTLNYSTYLTKPTWAQVTNGTMASWANVINGTMLSYAQALNNTLMQQANWNATNTSYFDLNKANTAGAFNQTFDTSTLFIDSVSNRVGIGTTSPADLLHITTGAQGNNGERLQSTSGGFLRLQPNTGSGGWNPIVTAGDSAIIFSNGTQEYGGLSIAPWSASTSGIRITNTGNVGIGTTSPGTKLQVKVGTDQNIGFSSDSSEARISVFNDAIDASVPLRLTASEFNFITGNVGIGTTTPQNTLDIVGSFNVSGASYLGNSKCSLGQVLTTDPTTGLISCVTDQTSEANASASGATDYISKFSSDTTLVSSGIYENSSTGFVGIGMITAQNKLNVVGDINATTSIFSQNKNLSIGYDYATNGSISTFESDPKWTSNYSNFTTLYGNDVSNASTRAYALNATPWTNNWTNFTTIYGTIAGNSTTRAYALNDSLWTLNYSTYLTKPTWAQVTNGTMASWANVVNGTMLSYAQALNNTLMQQANWNATNTSYFDLNKANTAGAFNQTFDTSTLFIDSVSDRVGIGTTSPATKLDVNSGAANAVTINVTDAATRKFIDFYGQGASSFNYGYFDIVASGLELKSGLTNGNLIFTPSGTGKVGINTTSPQNMLQINGGDNQLVISESGNRGLEIGFDTATNVSKLLAYDRGASTYNTLQLQGSPITFLIGGSEKARIHTDGNVGIGTTTPRATLDVDGSIYGSYLNNSHYPSYFTGGTYYMGMSTDVTARNLIIANKDNDGGTSSTNGQIQFKTGTTPSTRAVIDYQGNVGIGTTSPAQTLHVVGTSLEYSGTGRTDGILLNHTGSGNYEIKSIDSGLFRILANGGTFNIGQVSVPTLISISADGTTVAIDTNTLFVNATSNNVGIGTTSPNEEMELFKNQNGLTRFLINNTNAGASARAGILLNEDSAGGSFEILSSAYSLGVGYEMLRPNSVVIGSSGVGGISFTSSNGGNYTFASGYSTASERMRIVAGTGNVGIGTTSPSDKLQVTKAENIVGANDIDYPLIVSHKDSSGTGLWTNQGSGMLFRVEDGTTVTLDAGITGYRDTSDTNSSLGFSTMTDGTLSDKMRILANGNVGIGTTSPGTKFQVKVGTDQNVGFSSDSSEARISVFNDAIDASVPLRLTASEFNFITGNVGIGTTTPSSLFTTGRSAQTNEVNLSGVVYVNSTSGRVGIGTTSPIAPLTITSSSYPLITLGPSGDEDYYIGRDSGTGFLEFNGTQNTYSGYGFIINTSVTALRINNAGNVGIGTTTPSGALHVNSSASTGATTPIIERSQQTLDTGLISLRLLATKTTDMADGFGSLLNFNIQDNASVVNPIASIGGLRAGADNTGDLVFTTYTTGTASEKMRITSAGKVGIGTTTPQNTLNVLGDANASGTIYAQNTKNLSIGYDYATNGSISTFESDPKWTANFSNFTTLYGNDVSNASTRGYALNDSLWTLNYTDYLSIRGYALNDSLWTLNYSTYLTKPTWAQVTNGTMATWANVVNGTMLSYAQALNNTLMQQANWNATNTSYFDLNKANTAGAFNQTFDTSTLFINANDNRVGIGTTSPNYLLDVKSTGTSNVAGITASDGGTLFTFSEAASNNGWMRIFDGAGNADVTFSTAGDSYFNGGNVGIGTTSPGYKLDVNGTTQVDVLRIGATTNMGTITYGSGLGMVVKSASGQPLSLGAGNRNSDITINETTGNVGIGTTSPGTKFQVKVGTDQNVGFSSDSSEARISVFNDAIDASVPLRLTASEFNFITGNVGIGTTTPQNTLNVLGDINATTSVFAQSTKNLSIGYDYATNGSISTFESDPKWTANYSNFTTLYGNDVSNASTRAYALNATPWTNNWTNFTTIYGTIAGNSTTRAYALNDSLWTLNYSDYLTKPTWAQVTNGTMATWANVVNGTMLSYAQALNNTLMQQANWNATNTSYFDLNKANTAGAFNQTFDTSTLFIDSVSDRVGIGTTSPADLLHITTGAQGNNGERLQSTSGGFLRLQPNTGSGGWNPIVTAGDSAIIFSNGTQEYGGLSIAPWSASTSGIRITNTGNVGIGTTSPSEKLEINNGNISLSKPDAEHEISISLYSEGEINSRIAFSGDVGGSGTGGLDIRVLENFGISDLDQNSRFFIRENTGNVGINTNKPQNKLNVVGDANVTGNFTQGLSGSNTVSFFLSAPTFAPACGATYNHSMISNASGWYICGVASTWTKIG